MGKLEPSIGALFKRLKLSLVAECSIDFQFSVEISLILANIRSQFTECHREGASFRNLILKALLKISFSFCSGVMKTRLVLSFVVLTVCKAWMSNFQITTHLKPDFNIFLKIAIFVGFENITLWIRFSKLTIHRTRYNFIP